MLEAAVWFLHRFGVKNNITFKRNKDWRRIRVPALNVKLLADSKITFYHPSVILFFKKKKP